MPDFEPGKSAAGFGGAGGWLCVCGGVSGDGRMIGANDFDPPMKAGRDGLASVRGGAGGSGNTRSPCNGSTKVFDLEKPIILGAAPAGVINSLKAPAW